MEQKNKEIAVERMKEEIKEMIDKMDAGWEMGLRALQMTYGFVRVCCKNSQKESS